MGARITIRGTVQKHDTIEGTIYTYHTVRASSTAAELSGIVTDFENPQGRRAGNPSQEG